MKKLSAISGQPSAKMSVQPSAFSYQPKKTEGRSCGKFFLIAES